MIAKIQANVRRHGTPSFGVMLRNSTNGRFLVYVNAPLGDGVVTQCVIPQRWTNATTFSAAIGAVLETHEDYEWMKVANVAGVLTFSVSMDGKSWTDHPTTEAVAAFLTAAGGGTLDQIGIGFVQTSGTNLRALLRSFSAA